MLFEARSGPVRAVAISNDKKLVLTSCDDGVATLWSAHNGQEISRFSGHFGDVHTVAFSQDARRILTGGVDGTARIWGAETGEELCQLISFTDGGWAVVDPEGRYDASNQGSVRGLHFVAGLEPIALDQMRDRFYVPGLLAKIWNGEELPEVEKLTSVHLHPEVERVAVSDAGMLTVDLADQGGGFGAVEVRVDGKLVSADARPRGGVRSRDGRGRVTVDLASLPGVPLTPGLESTVAVRVRSEVDTWLVGRGTSLKFTPSGATPELGASRLLALCVGASDYVGDRIDLAFAAKDARDFATALRVGAEGLFNTGGANRVEITVLSTEGDDETPTRERVVRELERICANATAEDVVVLYLAGHGVTLDTESGDASEVFHYLCSDASTATPSRLASDEALRGATTVSSSELGAILNTTKARRRVVVLDTCAAGAALADMSTQRDLPTDQVRALTRFRDRTGMWVLGGCAADSVSYEASRYAQGVLTRSLLLGMRGAALGSGGEVDVSTLFEFAADTTEDLARGVGGIQRPQIFRPEVGSASFDVGLFPDEGSRARVPLEVERPILLRARFQDEIELDDTLGLSSAIDGALRDLSSRGGEARFVHIDANAMPGAVRLSGRYTVIGESLDVVMVLRQGDEMRRVEFSVSRAGASQEIAERAADEAGAFADTK